jgi:hypothetical protein
MVEVEQEPTRNECWRDSIKLEWVRRMVRAISDNNNDPTAGTPTEFTPSAATQMLPLVRRIVDDMVRLSRSIATQREQLRVIDGLPETIDQPDYQEEICDIRGTLVDDEQRLEACLRELSALGLEAHLPFDGSVDFPAVVNRRSVRLCWQPEDATVEYWHEIGQSQQERKKIDAQKFGVESLN